MEQAWAKGQDLDLPTLLARIMDPPFRKLGVFELDVFLPADERRELAMRLNALLASPTFAAWTEGQPLDIESLSRGPDGRPGAAVLYIAHLSDAERQFVVALVLSKLMTWMRQQSGSGDLRALVYLDEVFGFVPPTAQPPTKRVLLTLLKQGRAFGVGLLLATQNPVDLDYKAMSNAGTWMIGAAADRPNATERGSSRGCDRPPVVSTSRQWAISSPASARGSSSSTTRTTVMAQSCSRRVGRCPTCAGH